MNKILDIFKGKSPFARPLHRPFIGWGNCLIGQQSIRIREQCNSLDSNENLEKIVQISPVTLC